MVSKAMQLIAKRHQDGGVKHTTSMQEVLQSKCQAILNQPLAEKSIAQYRRTGARLDAQRGDSIQAVDISSFAKVRSTYYSYRTSVRFHAAEQGLVAIQDRINARSSQSLADADKRMQKYLADLTAYPVDRSLIVNAKLVQLGLQDAKKGVPSGEEQKKTRGSKLKDMKKIAKKYPDWRSLVWNRLVDMKSPWLTYAAIAALTGARPEELGSVEYHLENGTLTVKVKGAKVTDTKGQPWRTFGIEDDGSLEYAYLHAHSTSSVQVTEPLTRKHADAFSAALSRAGATTMPDAPRMSGYVYRHAFASDLKRSGVGREVIAAALGHAVTKTQDAYGRALSSTGSRKVSIDSARQVRITHDSSFFTSIGSARSGMSLSVLSELKNEIEPK